MFEDEGAFFLLEQAADVVDEQAVAAVVVREGVMDGGIGGGLEVGVDVRAAKAVNRLFGVADEEERVAVGGKGAAEDFVLQRVGVLESSIRATRQFCETASASLSWCAPAVRA